MTDVRSILLILATLLAWPCAAGAAPAPEQRFAAGVAAFRAGHLEQARDEFLAAQRAGLDTPQLQYDLALAYYKLGQDAEARAAFERLKSAADFADIADFHLALLAVRAGRRDEAEQALGRIANEAAVPAVRERARVALQRLRHGDAQPFSAYVLAAVGQDTNPGQVDDSVQAPAEASAFLDVFGTFDVPVSGNRAAATRVRGGAYLYDYSKDNGLDQRGVFGTIVRTLERDRRAGNGYLQADLQQLDGAAFMNVYTAGLAAGPLEGATGFSVRGQASRIDAAPAYGYLDGWRARAEVERADQFGGLRSRTGYQFEFNARDDLQSGSEFFSHSPLRHSVWLAVDRPLGAAGYLDASLRYRNSRYRRPNRFLDGGTLREERRVEDQLQASLQLRYSFSETLGGVLEYRYTRNEAGLEDFSYRRQVLSLGLEWAPHR